MDADLCIKNSLKGRGYAHTPFAHFPLFKVDSRLKIEN